VELSEVFGASKRSGAAGTGGGTSGDGQ